MESVEVVLFNYLRDAIYEPDDAFLDIEKLPENFREYGQGLKYFVDCVTEARGFAMSLSKGDLAGTVPSYVNELAAPLKSLQASLKHLTWQAQQIAKGDYQQQVSFMGDFATAFNSMAKQLDERRKLEMQEKSELQQYINMILTNTPNVVLMFDVNDKAVLASEMFFRQTKMPPEELQGKTVENLFSAFTTDDFIRNISSLIEIVRAGKTTLTVEHEIDFGQDGEIRTYIIRLTPIFRDDDTYMGTMLLFDDVTEIIHVRKMNEVQLTLMNLMVKGTKIGIWDVEIVAKSNPLGSENAFNWSDEFRQMLGFSDADDFPNVITSWSDRLHPEDKEKTLAALDTHLNDLTGKTPYDVEYRLLRKNNEYAYYRATGETIRDEDGYPIHIAGALMDITEAKHVLLETDRQRLEAQAANRAKNEFLARISHEMRTPMNAIMGMASIGLNAQDNNRREYCLNNINQAAQHLLFVINDVLDISEIEGDTFELALSEFSFESLITNIKNVTELQAKKKKQRFVVDLDPAIPITIIADEKRLTQVLHNILSNAVKFTPDRGSISLTAMRIGGSSEPIVASDTPSNEYCTIRFIVKDSGIGISEKNFEKIFAPFEQADGGTSRKFEGTGLGLAISKRIVEMMDGSIWFESEPGKGTTFTFEIKAWIGEDANTDILSTCGIFVGKRILIAEDIEINCEIIAALLEDTGVEIDFAYNGVQAVEKFISAPNDYGLIFMDIRMPEMDGYEATRSIRSSSLPEGKDIPIVAMTANASQDDVAQSLASGMNAHLCKPLNVKDLFRTMRRYLSDKRSTSE